MAFTRRAARPTQSLVQPRDRPRAHLHESLTQGTSSRRAALNPPIHPSIPHRPPRHARRPSAAAQHCRAHRRAATLYSAEHASLALELATPMASTKALALAAAVLAVASATGERLAAALFKQRAARARRSRIADGARSLPPRSPRAQPGHHLVQAR